jgi:NAD+ kinase
MFKRIGIITRQDAPGVRDTLRALISGLEGRDVEVAVDEHGAALDPSASHRMVAETDIGNGRDLVIAIGGDGTLLHAARLVFPRKVPLLGVNLGRLGFLTDLSPAQMNAGVDAILDGAFVREHRLVLGCAVIRSRKTVAEGQGLNDVVVQKWNTARLITFDTLVDGQFVHSQRSDGMTVSTPTGSTAYALSGGGPILHPDLDAIALVPICPHTLTNRPIVISASSTVDIKIGTEREDEARLTCDGNPISRLEPGDKVRVYKHPNAIHLIHPADHDHFATLRAKLHWGRDLC